MRPAIARHLKGGDLGTTFGGGPVIAAAIEAVIDAIAAEGLLENVQRISQLIRERCLVGPVESIQGRGFLLGLRTRMPAAKLRDALLERDILAGTSSDPHVLRLLPPLTLASEHVDQLANALGDIEDAAV
jgi:acetylornithine/succinyldiaminopimelate/putrescine aminotransferase